MHHAARPLNKRAAHAPHTDSVRIAVLRVIPRVFVFIALAAWLVTFVGLIRSVGGTLRAR